MREGTRVELVSLRALCEACGQAADVDARELGVPGAQARVAAFLKAHDHPGTGLAVTVHARSAYRRAAEDAPVDGALAT